MPADGCLGQALVQQVRQERREHLDDLLAHEDVCGLDEGQLPAHEPDGGPALA